MKKIVAILFAVVLMLCAFINIQVFKNLSCEFVFREHALNYTANETVGTIWLSHDCSGSVFTLSTRIACVVQIDAVVPLIASHFDFVGIDDDNIVATIYVRGKVWFVFTAE